MKEGVLKLQPSGRWAICRLLSLEITSGELFQVEGDGVLKPTRMEFAHGERGRPGEYYSVDGFELRSGLQAAIGE